jgi:hypothetical protein
MDVPFAELPDLSTHVVTVAPFDGGVPVPAGSAPSSHRAQPVIFVGINGVVAGNAVIGICWEWRFRK